MAVDYHELQVKLIYAMIVAGKSARFANQACHRFFRNMPVGTLPFTWIRGAGRQAERGTDRQV
jgi:hypothetical protein